MEFGLSGVKVEFYNIKMGWCMGVVVGKTLLLFVMLQAKIKGYMRELDMWSSVGVLNGIHQFRNHLRHSSCASVDADDDNLASQQDGIVR
jgi:hypothetical protein